MLPERKIGLIPFFCPPGNPEYPQKVLDLEKTVKKIGETVDSVVVVDDGSRLSETGDIFVQLTHNQGKAEAIRAGTSIILKKFRGHIVQLDADLDQNPKEAPKLLDYMAHSSPNQLLMVIGDRYPRDIKNISPVYRQGLVILQTAICKALEYEIRDPVSGFRAYTTRLAQYFVDRGISQRYGIEFEQVVIARLVDASVGAIRLSYSRPRDPYTLAGKLGQSGGIVFEHRKALKARGFGILVDFFEYLQGSIAKGVDQFDLDLSNIGSSGLLTFVRQDNKYTIKIRSV